MTPLAQEITNELTKPLKERWCGQSSSWRKGCGRLIDTFARGEIHCFEVTEVWDTARALVAKSSDIGRWYPSDELHFLPAPQTWVEWREPTGLRQGYLLEEIKYPKDLDGMPAGTPVLTATGALKPKDRWGENPIRLAWHRNGPKWGGSPLVLDDISEGTDFTAPSFMTDYCLRQVIPALCAFLALINSPRVIGRRQHMPHAGLQRQLAKARGMVGKFPLQAWTEIKLEVRPAFVEEGAPQEAYLTGARALHFCRAHLRIRNGRLEYVSSHWRGDPSVGIKQSRYKLAMPV